MGVTTTHFIGDWMNEDLNIKAVIDGIDAMVVVLDNQGFIIETNDCWDSFIAKEHDSLSHFCKGGHYLHLINDVVAKAKLQPKSSLIEGVEQVVKGEKQMSYGELPIDANEKANQTLHVTAKRVGKEHILITHKVLSNDHDTNHPVLASEDDYGSLVLALSEGIIFHDEKGRIKSCNRSAELILGYPKDQLFGLSSASKDWGIVYEDGTPFPGSKHPVVVSLKTGKPMRNVIMGYYKPNGILTWLSVNSQPIFKNDNGTIKGVVVSFTDITIKKYVEDQLQGSLEELSNLKNAIYESAVISVTDLKGIILDVNEAFCEASQYLRKELIGQYHNIVKSNYHDEAFYQNMWQTISGGRIWRGELKNKSKDDTSYWLDVVIAPMTNARGAVYQYLSIGYLITDKKRYEERVEQSEELYKRLVERFTLATKHSNIGLWEYQHASGEMYMDDSLLELYELNKQGLRNNRSAFQGIISEDDYLLIEDKIRNAVEHLSNFEHTFRAKLKSGKEKHITSLGRAYSDENKNLILVGLDRDVTVELENERKIKGALEEKETLLREIHHRVKNNLQLISSILSIKSYEIDNEHAVKVFKECISRVRSMANIHEKLYQSELTSEINVRPYFEELIREVEVSYLSLYGNAKIDCSIDSFDITIDKALALGLILNELISNAFKHGNSDHGNEITVRLTAGEQDSHTLMVANKGAEIPVDLFSKTKGMMGIMLINTFVNQINGRIAASHEHGYNTITLKF